MSEPDLRTKVEEILKRYSSTPMVLPKFPSQADKDIYYINRREKYVDVILDAVMESVPEKQSRNDSLAPKPADGWNACREEMLRRLK